MTAYRWVCPHDPNGTDRDTGTYCGSAVRKPYDAEVSDYLRRAQVDADLIRRGLVPGEENE